MNWKKHECSLLEVFSDVGSTPTASTIFLSDDLNLSVVIALFCRAFRVFVGANRGENVV
jgi:hypothetical protein